MVRKSGAGENLKCSFCGKTQDEVRRLIAGPMVYICDECVDLCNDIMVEEWTQEKSAEFRRLLNALSIHGREFV